MYKPESLLGKTHQILWNFEIQTDHQIPARRPDLVSINKKKITCHLVHFCRSSKPLTENKRKRNNEQILVSGHRAEKAMEHECDVDTNCNWCHWNALEKTLGELEIRGRIEIIHTTAQLKSARILWRGLESWGDLLSLRLKWKIPSLNWFEKRKMSRPQHYSNRQESSRAEEICRLFDFKLPVTIDVKNS